MSKTICKKNTSYVFDKFSVSELPKDVAEKCEKLNVINILKYTKKTTIKILDRKQFF